MRKLLSVTVLVLIVVLEGTTAWALPSERPDDTWMVDGSVVRAVVYSKGLVFLGGRFRRVTQNPPGTPGDVRRAINLVALGAASGTPRWTARIEHTTATATVWNLATSPDGSTLYVCGQFNRVNGRRRKNVAALDAHTGRFLRSFRPRSDVCWSVAASSRTVFVGQDAALAAFAASDGAARWSTPTDDRVLSVVGGRTRLFAGGAFRTIGGHPRPIAARLDPATGRVDTSWVLGNGARIGINAFVHELLLARGALYLAAGGSDFAARFDAGDGALVWKTDTSGSTQTIQPYGTDDVVIGGHFQWVADADTRQCGDNRDPVTTCTMRLRLAALDAATGDVDPSWDPQLTGAYNGARGLAIDEGGRLHVGGEFLRVAGVEQHHYVRLGA